MSVQMKSMKFEFVPPSPLPPSPLPEKSVIAILKLKAFILAEPRRYNQEYFIVHKKKKTDYNSVLDFQKPPCGTAACLAGSAALMEGYIGSSMRMHLPNSRKLLEIGDLAGEILGLDPFECEKLFDANPNRNWCSVAANAYVSSQEMLDDESGSDNYEAFKARAEAAAMELDHLIATGKVGDVR